MMAADFIDFGRRLFLRFFFKLTMH